MAIRKTLYYLVLCFSSCFEVTISQTACPLHTIPNTGIQSCTSILGFLNATVNTREEICGVYSESLNCMKRFADGAGLNCSLNDVIEEQKQINFVYTTYSLDTCPVKEFTADLCMADDRLSTYAFLSCRPYLDQFADMGSEMACMYTKYLMECVTQNTGMLGTTCTTENVQRAILSKPATTWLHWNYPGINLRQCFQTHTIPVQTDMNCRDFPSLFSLPNVPRCLSGIYNLNLSNPADTQMLQAGCSAMQEMMACMVKQASQAGSDCTMSQMKAAIQAYLSMTTQIPNDFSLFVRQCPADDSYLRGSICGDDVRLSNFLSITGSPILSAVNRYNNRDLMCTTIKSSADILLNTLGITCSAVEVFLALVKPHGRTLMASTYPNIDTHHCAITNGVHVPVVSYTSSVKPRVSATTTTSSVASIMTSSTASSPTTSSIQTADAVSSVASPLNRFAPLNVRQARVGIVSYTP